MTMNEEVTNIIDNKEIELHIAEYEALINRATYYSNRTNLENKFGIYIKLGINNRSANNCDYQCKYVVGKLLHY